MKHVKYWILVYRLKENAAYELWNTWAKRDVETTELIKRIKTFIVREKNDRSNLAHRYRLRIHQVISG